ncbi:MAG: hypothetical protein OEV00_08030, partial [Acidobacteriota bacterium]|nr:hypothetical protein [Acidobacteriota bacterium]
VGCVAAVTETKPENDEITLQGEFVWGRGEAQPIKAVFSPTGEDAYDVSFYFQFRGRDHVYTGTATGEMGTGKMSGNVLNDSKVRTFTFEGQFDDGQFIGEHAETTAGNENDTGSIWLK